MSQVVKAVLRDMSLEEYASKKLDARWLKVVEDLDPYAAAKVKECRTFATRGKAADGCERWRGSLCRVRDLCPTDAYAFTNDEAEDGYEVLNEITRAVGGKVRIYAGELTLPGSLWKRVRDSDLPTLRRFAIEAVTEVFGKDERCMAGKCEHKKWRGECKTLRYWIASQASFHFWHSGHKWFEGRRSSPFDGFYPHIHLNVPQVVFDLWTKTFVKLNMWRDFEKGEETVLAAAFRRKVEKLYAVETRRKWVAKWQYRSGRASVVHRLSYAMRNPVIDVYRAIVDGAIYLPLVHRAWLQRLLLRPKEERRSQWSGWLANGVRKKMLALANIQLKSKLERRRIRRRKFCPHGFEIEFERFSRMPISSVRVYRPNAIFLSYGKPKAAVVIWDWERAREKLRR